MNGWITLVFLGNHHAKVGFLLCAKEIAFQHSAFVFI